MIALLEEAVDVGLMKPCSSPGCIGLVWIGKGTLCPDCREESRMFEMHGINEATREEAA